MRACIYIYIYVYTWRFPKIGVPPNHPFDRIFHYKASSYWVLPFQDTAIYIYIHIHIPYASKGCFCYSRSHLAYNRTERIYQDFHPYSLWGFARIVLHHILV